MASRYASIWKRLSDNIIIAEDGSLKEDLLCVLCKKVLLDATVNTSCGCQYCYQCVSDYVTGDDQYCPGVNEECSEQRIAIGTNVYRSELLNKKVSKLKVNCPNNSCGCNIELMKIDDHLCLCKKQPIRCPYSPIGCNVEDIFNETLKPHLHSNIVPHTELLIEIIQNLKNDLYEMKKDYGNSKLLIASLSESSLEKDRKIATMENEIMNANLVSLNQNTIIKKELDEQKKLIEEAKIERETMKEDINAYKTEIRFSKEEIVIDKRRIDMLQDQWRKKELEKQKNENEVSRIEREKMKDDFVNVLNEVSRINDALARYEGLLQTMKEEIREMRNGMEIRYFNELEKQKKKVIVSKRSTLPRISINGNSNNDDRKRSLSLHNNSGGNINADFEWQIEELSKNFDTQIYSDGFYSNNYKLCLYMFISRGNDSICFHCYIMKGLYDENIDWPMRRSVTLSIGDAKSRQVYGTMTYKAEFKKPISERGDHVGSRVFVSFSSIREESSVTLYDSITASCVLR